MKLITKKIINIFIVFVFCAISYMLQAICVLADNMESSRYQMKFTTIDIGGASMTSSDVRLTTSIGQTAAHQFDSDGYTVKAGFQYIYSIIPFRFSISKTNIDFGNLIPNQPSEVSSTLTVSFGGSGQYQVTAAEEGPLQTMAGVIIPDTKCNGNKNTCDETIPQPWDARSAYGFGYSMDINGKDIPQSFINCYQSNGNKPCYRPFPDTTEPTPEPPAILMSSTNVGRNKQANIKFKVNIPANQTTGSYQTIVSFVATPTY